MLAKTVTTTNKRNIRIYDEVFSRHQVNEFYSFIRSSLFVTNGGDSDVHDINNQIFSAYSEKDVANLGIQRTFGFQSISRNHNLFACSNIHNWRIIYFKK